MSKQPEDAATKVAWDADRILAALRSRPTFEFTVGELIWLVNMAQNATFNPDAPEFEAEAKNLLEKASGEEADS